MSSGKQLSFSFGEVSPSLRFRANVSFYSQALSSLLNGYVRKSGGVSNRPGTIHWMTPTYQPLIPRVDKPVGVKLFAFTGSDDVRYMVELQYRVLASDAGGFRYPPLRIFNLDDGTIYDTFMPYASDPGGAEILLDLESAEMVNLSDSAVITFNTGRIFVIDYNPELEDPLLKWGITSVLPSPAAIGTPAALTGLAFVGQVPTDIPVCYLVTQEQTDGSEVVWQEGCSLNGHPHSQLSSSFTLDAQAGNGVKQYNIYRSAGEQDGTQTRGSSYALVGRIKPSATGITFKDFITVPDLSTQPPIQTDIYPLTDYVRRVVYYKERTIVLYKRYRYPGSTVDAFIEGQVGASKLGAPGMFGRPLTPNNTDAFTFTVPSDKLSRITNALVMNRLILFTKDYTFSIRGGEGGVLTPQTVNPEQLYGEGCTPDVSPVAAGNRGYFISYDKSKLLTIKFSQEDSSTAAVGDASTLSDHLFEERNIRRLAITNAGDNILWILKKDGTLVSLTLSEEGGVQGFARHDTDGFIEDICVQTCTENLYPADTGEFTVPVLYLSVIREGVRYYERMAVRDDIDVDRYLYADAATVFGDKFQDDTDETNMHINISADQATITDDLPTGDFSAGQVLTLTDMADTGEFSADWEGRVYDFFYGTDYASSVRIYVDTYVDAITLLAHCEEDIPAALQDINVQDEDADGVALTYEDKVERQMKFLRAFNQLTGLTHLAERDVSVFADGQVIASPNDPTKTVLTVDVNGVLDLPAYYNRGYVGLPYTMEMETLNIEAADDRTLMDSGKLINKVGIALRNTVGGYVGSVEATSLSDMELIHNGEANSPINGYHDYPIPSHWEQTGKVIIKQIDPAPMTVLAVYPKGVSGD